VAGDQGRDRRPEGAIGRKSLAQRDAARSRKRGGTREELRREVMRSGLLGMLENSGLASNQIFGPGGLGNGINNAMGGLRGVELGDADGTSGLGTRGNGPGAGGNGIGI